MKNPLVSVVCLCYNQQKFVKVAIQSVLDQRYPNVELIIVDDHSTDGSKEVIEQFIASHPGIKFFPLDKNIGNCKAFNLAYKHAKGDYIIDLAADDILMVDRIEKGVDKFKLLGSEYGINYSEAEIIDEDGNFLSNFYLRKKGKIKPRIAEGYIFPDLLERYFICPPTLMFRREVYDSLNGYDEKLAYEDFDFLLRASKKFKFCFIDQPLVKRRIVKKSMSQQQYKKNSPQLISTYHILRKAIDMTDNDIEKRALKKRIRYEGRKTLQLYSWNLTLQYIRLYFTIK